MQQAIAIADYEPEENQEGYLHFKKEDTLNIQQFYDNGWAYGFNIDYPDVFGYIPINHIELIQHNTQEIQQERPLTEKEKKDLEWLKYVSGLMQHNQVIETQTAESKPNTGQVFLPYSDADWGYEGIQPTKQVKTDSMFNPQKMDMNLSIPGKEAQNSKQYKQLSRYFDYDKWIDYVNQTGQVPKGKPDPKRKKTHKKFNLKLRENKF